MSRRAEEADAPPIPSLAEVEWMRQGRSAPEHPSSERPTASRQDAAATSNSLCRRVRPCAREYRRRVRLTRWAVVV
ncbi:hypothetical protein KZX06_08275 [Micrococcus sp. EYE_162]|uniref:hypothetical protein n=1 Tax=unclassified Micrococcus TaxID=2620948 RepID=UPI0020035383|nr:MULTISPECIES: hypothetical protein [unclassified Micrococcus]MCK6095933.1 hypothetical protein [Micrococcus sp. EYE_212]MCK6172024.1 hypothetical protein [Micrococcus sp. EYE_162]